MASDDDDDARLLEENPPGKPRTYRRNINLRFLIPRRLRAASLTLRLAARTETAERAPCVIRAVSGAGNHLPTRWLDYFYPARRLQCGGGESSLRARAKVEDLRFDVDDGWLARRSRSSAQRSRICIRQALGA
jgi:hypothetical protein